MKKQLVTSLKIQKVRKTQEKCVINLKLLSKLMQILKFFYSKPRVNLLQALEKCQEFNTEEKQIPMNILSPEDISMNTQLLLKTPTLSELKVKFIASLFLKKAITQLSFKPLCQWILREAFQQWFSIL
ncbi:hypothetical protein TTHERM_000138239 (macronuclear) [Tetrahymena thermophila SB210]|uniref:Uncharacterized protein n=1 Tax=Tetrahymena thermophila (strain SB210) TaxID=312017 RepID=W7X2K0_TETTS|nr:hypothetical protein TTHERM_000138239 [Tetrahymena thermophila SB210]EWS73475.1 hypothetical protein TTHERM_000138239 [Tetrahymena thermophila SB210]|eukprot:XP_012653957.1 hypothetical protein TTHERM_000138239 [Tetrahymena thermophila SB210]